VNESFSFYVDLIANSTAYERENDEVTLLRKKAAWMISYL